MLNRIKPSTTVVDLAMSKLLDELSGNELVVYLRLVALTAREGSTLRVANRDLHPVQRSATRALDTLASRGLVRLTYAKVDNSRMIEVVK